MENNLEIKKAPFLGTELIAARDSDGQIWVGARRICNGIGLSRGQINREIAAIQSDEVLKEGCTKFDAGVFDPSNATIALKLDFIPLWLAKISITPAMKMEHPELAATLKEYQLRAKDVLAATFLPVSVVPNLDTLSPELRVLISLELKQKEQAKALEEVSRKVEDIKDVVALSPNSWRPDARNLIVRIARKLGGNEYIREVQTEIFKLVDDRAGVSLETRLTNKRRRMADEGACKSKRDRLNKVDVIADDKKLIEIYLAVVKDMALKYGATTA